VQGALQLRAAATGVVVRLAALDRESLEQVLLGFDSDSRILTAALDEVRHPSHLLSPAARR
jgi:hypothetical protein